MTNAEKLRRILKETFPNVIFIWGFSEERKEVSIHMSTNWLEDSYTEKEQEPCEDGMWSLKDAADALKRHGLLQRQEPCEDAISRKAVLEAIDTEAWEYCDYLISKGRNDEQKPVSHFADNLRSCIREDLPSVTPKSKMGHWIYKLMEGQFCSECNEPCVWKFNFCPNCGAKMAESEDKE